MISRATIKFGEPMNSGKTMKSGETRDLE